MFLQCTKHSFLDSSCQSLFDTFQHCINCSWTFQTQFDTDQQYREYNSQSQLQIDRFPQNKGCSRMRKTFHFRSDTCQHHKAHMNPDSPFRFLFESFQPCNNCNFSDQPIQIQFDIYHWSKEDNHLCSTFPCLSEMSLVYTGCNDFRCIFQTLSEMCLQSSEYNLQHQIQSEKYQDCKNHNCLNCTSHSLSEMCQKYKESSFVGLAYLHQSENIQAHNSCKVQNL
mmetsp:Transcript_42314/g.88555  ORF Transcript_42314/g.88555 Transcript_42314/m.88555 type:complete len:225 (-) Transcript_42314:3565-4239(-)